MLVSHVIYSLFDMSYIRRDYSHMASVDVDAPLSLSLRSIIIPRCILRRCTCISVTRWRICFEIPLAKKCGTIDK